MFNKVLNVPLIFLALPKINASYLSTINDEKAVLKSSNFTLRKCYYAKKRIRTLNTIKMLCARCSMKEENCGFLSGKNLNFHIKSVPGKEFGVKFCSVKLKLTSMIQITLFFRNVIIHRSSAEEES